MYVSDSVKPVILFYGGIQGYLIGSNKTAIDCSREPPILQG
uniref:Uncharacterized protein n=1 Tax=Anguilla anguilla TaxID=7936 RepID=A0A0E9VBQ7_ANGAN